MNATGTTPRIPGRGARYLALLAACAVFAAVAAPSASAYDPQIAAGLSDACTVSQTGVLRCMGLNDSGQLGVTTNMISGDPTPTPQVVALGGPVVQVAIGNNHTCAVLADGTVKCFGGNRLGQLGTSVNNGTSTPNPDPQTVPLAGPATAVSAGQWYSCALLQSGAVQCWGTNQFGTLGVSFHAGTTNPNPTPQTVLLGGPAIKIASGTFHSCAVIVGGTVQCWGSNYSGQLGNSTSIGLINPVLPLPAGVSGVSTDVSAGGSHTCVLKQDASVECFGVNRYGELANSTHNGSETANPVPAAVPLGGAQVKQVAAGGNFTCALLTDGSVRCFGDNDGAQLGSTTDNGTDAAHPTPVAIGGLAEPVIRLAAGQNFVCAILRSGSVQCWGYNGAGQLGQSGTGRFATPMSVPGLSLFDAPLPPPTPPTPPKINYSVNKPKLKSKKSGKKLLVTSTVIVGGDAGALSAASCTGNFTATLSTKVKNKRTHKTRTKRYAKKSFALALRAGKCSLQLKFKLPRATAGKKLSLALSFAGSATINSYSQTFAEKIPRGR